MLTKKYYQLSRSLDVQNAGDPDINISGITIYLPKTQMCNRTAVLICPGGGYGILCSSYEGHDIAKWLGKYGIVGAVLNYHISPYRHPIQLEDAKRAMRVIRQNAKDWGINPDCIGVIGFSAGGHLASMLGTQADEGILNAADPIDRMSCRPNFMALLYPVISMNQEIHGGSMANLLGPRPSQLEKDNVSSELHVSSKTPATFLVHSVKDSVVSVMHSRCFFEALKEKGVLTHYTELQNGDHGLGCGQGEIWNQWQSELIRWLHNETFISIDNTLPIP